MLLPVSSPTFAQPAQRNLLAPVLLAFLILGLLLALVIRLTPHRTPDLTILHTDIVPTHTVFKSDVATMDAFHAVPVHSDPAEDNLYVLTTLRIDDRLRLPLFLKDFTADLVTADGQQYTTSAVEERDLPNLYTGFPSLRDRVPTPLLRETMIAPGASTQGVLVLHFPVTRDQWDRRRSATLNVNLYHQDQQTIPIGRETETIVPPASTPAANGR